MTNLTLPSLVGPFQRHHVDGNMLNDNDFIDSFQDLVDLDNVEIKPIFAKLLFKKLTEWKKKNDGKVPRALLSTTDSVGVKASSTVIRL